MLGGAAARQLLLERLRERPLLAGRAAREYLKPASFAAAEGGPRGQRRDVRPSTVTRVPAPRRRSRSRAFVLLDHMDWLARHPQLLEEEWSRASSRSCQPERRGSSSGAADSDARLPAAGVLRRLHFERERAHALHAPRPRRHLWLLPHRPPRVRLRPRPLRTRRPSTASTVSTPAIYDWTRPLLLLGRRGRARARAARRRPRARRRAAAPASTCRDSARGRERRGDRAARCRCGGGRRRRLERTRSSAAGVTAAACPGPRCPRRP